MSTQFLLDEGDIENLTKLMLVMLETQESRKQLCRELGINPQEVAFIIGTSDDTFCTQLIECLNRYGYQEYLCKLCCDKLYPILNKSAYSHRLSILEKIIEKLNCNCNFNHDSENNFPQEQIRKQPTPARINRKQFLFWVGLGGASLVTAVVGYEIFNNPSFTPEKKYPSDEQIYTIVTAGGLDSAWRISMEGNSAAWGIRAITNWTQKVERNSEFKLIYKRNNNAYEIRPRVEINGDACLTTFPNGFLSLNKCDDTLYQNFAIDCEKKDIAGNLSECNIVNKATNNPIGTEWDNPDKSNKPNIERKNYTSDNARWWSFVVQGKR